MGKSSRISILPSFRQERALAGPDCNRIAGVDEAGRGPWAGPVVAAAVIFPKGRGPKGLNDSKCLSAREREGLYEAVCEQGLIGVGIVSVEEIDRINILQATFLAMRQALTALSQQPDMILIDGNKCPPDLPVRAMPVIEGDRKCPSIAAASIIAKVTRDRMMLELAQSHPGYYWHSNKGYGTRQHARAISELGVTSHHRRSFAPIRSALAGGA